METYEIKDWKRSFWLKEAAKHDQVSWTKFPVSTEAMSYKRLMATREGRDAYCVFVAIVQMVARKRMPGVLSHEGVHILPEDIALATGLPVKAISSGIELLASEPIAWLIPTEAASDAVLPPISKRRQNGEEPADERRKTALDKEQELEEESTPTPTPKRESAPVACGGGGEIHDSGLEGRKAHWRKKPEWWPSKPWLSARGVNELAVITREFTQAEVDAILKDAKRQCPSLANPAGYLIKSIRDAAKSSGGAAPVAIPFPTSKPTTTAAAFQ